MINSIIDVVDALNNSASNLAGASDALSYWATIEGEDLAAMLSCVLGDDAEVLREASRWLEEHAGDLRVIEHDAENGPQPV